MRNVVILSLSMLFAFTALFSWSYLFPVHLKDLGANDTEIGIAYTLFALALTLFQFLGGILADRFGRRLMIVVPAILIAPLTALLLHAETWLVAAGVFVLLNIAGAIQFPAFNAILAESTENRKRAFIWFEAALSFGGAIGPIAGALILADPEFFNIFNLSSGMESLFAIAAILSMLAAIVVYIALQETKQSTGHVHERIRLSDITRPNIRWFVLSASFAALVLSISILGPFITLHLEEVMGQSNSQINIFWAIGWGMAALLSLFGERLVQRIGPKAVLMWSVLLHSVTLLIWALVGNHIGHVIPFILTFLLAQFVLVGNHMMTAELTTPSNRGRIAGLIGAFVGIIRSFGPVVAMEARIALGLWLPFGLAVLWGIAAFLSLIPCKLNEPAEENNAVSSP